MSGGLAESYLSEWRAADPMRPCAWLFLRPAERIRYGACAALVREWWKILHELREPQVAAAKLGWWREELQRAAEGGARHPLTQTLFADARVGELPLAYWTDVVDAALPGIAAPPSADFAAQQQAAGPLAAAIARLETRLWFGAQAEEARAIAVTTIGNLVADARALAMEAEHGRSPLPMNLMARHGLTVEALAAEGAGRSAAMRDYARVLHEALAGAAAMPGPLTLFRAVGLQHDMRSLHRSAYAEDPLAVLREAASGFGPLLKTWRAARMWRAIPRTEVQA